MRPCHLARANAVPCTTYVLAVPCTTYVLAVPCATYVLVFPRHQAGRSHISLYKLHSVQMRVKNWLGGSTIAAVHSAPL